MAKKTKKSTMYGKCDPLYARLVQARYGRRCARCGSTGYLETSHVLPKGAYPSMRYVEENARPMCYRDHRIFWHHNPLEASEWFETMWPGEKQKLYKMANTLTHVDLEADYRRLKARAAALGF